MKSLLFGWAGPAHDCCYVLDASRNIVILLDQVKREETLLLRAVVVDVVAAAVDAVAAATPLQFLLQLLLLLPLLQPITHKALTPAPGRTVVRHACRYTVLL